MACSVEEIHVGDIGTVFEVTLNDCDAIVDLTGALSQELIFKKPDKSVITRTTVFKTDGTDGIITYTTVANDLDQKNSWQVQAKVTLPTGTWSSDIHKFKVYDNL